MRCSASARGAKTTRQSPNARPADAGDVLTVTRLDRLAIHRDLLKTLAAISVEHVRPSFCGLLHEIDAGFIRPQGGGGRGQQRRVERLRKCHVNGVVSREIVP